jgi:hypothetical protein
MCGVCQDMSVPCTMTSEIHCASPSCWPLHRSYNLISVELSLCGHHGSHLVPWNNYPCDEILSKLLLRKDIWYVWFILLSIYTFCTSDYLPVAVSKCVLLSDSALWAVIACSCWVLTAPLLCKQSVHVWVSAFAYLSGVWLSSAWLLSWQLLWRCCQPVQIPWMHIQILVWLTDVPFSSQQYPLGHAPISVAVCYEGLNCLTPHISHSILPSTVMYFRNG